MDIQLGTRVLVNAELVDWWERRHKRPFPLEYGSIMVVAAMSEDGIEMELEADVLPITHHEGFWIYTVRGVVDRASRDYQTFIVRGEPLATRLPLSYTILHGKSKQEISRFHATIRRHYRLHLQFRKDGHA